MPRFPRCRLLPGLLLGLLLPGLLLLGPLSWPAASAALAAAPALAPALAPVLASALAPSLRFEQLGVEQGLAQESVLAIAQDRQGFMWFGSQAGLSRHDGYRSITYRNEVSNPASLADNWVRVLHVDRQGRLWAGTDGGLDRFDPASGSFIHYLPREEPRRGNGNRHVRAIVDDGAGGFWIATGDGLQRFDPATGRFTAWHHEPGVAGSLGDDEVTALAMDGGGRLWVGSASGLDSLAPGATRFEHHRSLQGARFQGVQALLVDAGQTLWIGAGDSMEQWPLQGPAVRQQVPQQVLQQVQQQAQQQVPQDRQWVGGATAKRPLQERAMTPDPATGSLQRRRLGAAAGLPASPVSTIYQDADAQVWVGSFADGLYRWQASASRFVRYSHQAGDSHSVADNRISSLYRDRFGALWVGTWYSGVSRVDLGSGGFARIVKMTDIDDGRHLSDSRVRAIADDGHGRLWMGTNNGLNHFDQASGAAQVYHKKSAGRPGLNSEQVTALWRDRRSGVLWIGGDSGVNRLDAEGRNLASVSFAAGGESASDVVRGIMGDRAGLLWVGTRGGLHRFDPRTGKFRTFRHDPADSASLADNIVRPVLEDRHGALWIGTFNGLDLLDRTTGRFRHFRHDPNDPYSLSHDEVHCLFEDRHGTLWVGTADGLNRMEAGPGGTPRFRRYLRGDGLADAGIAAIADDAAGGLWMSSNSGIARLDMVSGQVRNYTGADGTIEGAYFDGAVMRGADGILYFGGFNGVTAFAPEAIRANSVAPAVVITDFQIFNQAVRAGQGAHPEVLTQAIEHTSALTLNARDAVFSLEFAALHYAAPQRNRFAYQLQGFDHEWVQTDASKHFATYTNLDPGDYVFRVKASNKDGVWNDAGATLAITILPPYWKTWWWRSLLAALLAGSMYALYRVRIGGMRRQKRRLEQQVGLRTAEVELKNQLLLQQKEELEQRRAEAECQAIEAEQRGMESERQKEEVERQRALLQQQEKQVRLQSDALARANGALQENGERLRLATQKAEDATRQKSEFLADMSHEMRTPLAGVIGMLGFALRDTRLHAGTREQILRGQANTQALLAIINDLLDFSKIEAGKLNVEHIAFALGPALDDVASLFEEIAAGQGVAFDIEFGAGLPPFVAGDPGRLRQVLVNLVGNAFKFTSHGAVMLRVERVGAAPAGASLISFSVQDSGIGIAPEAMARLFRKFEQADASTTRRYGGSGLGLAICRQLVELMGGTIDAVSEAGVGSAFTFVLPLAEAAPPLAAPKALPMPRHSHSLRVLCAEDFPTNQIIIRTMLEELGHRVDIAANGALAVAACAATQYDLVLMDGRMPDMDGASVARLIRAGGPVAAPVLDPQLCIVALTANASDEDRSHYMAAGMDDFLSKPIDIAALHWQLTRAIGRQLARGYALTPMVPPPPEPLELPELQVEPPEPHLEPPEPQLEPLEPQLEPGKPAASALDAMFGVAAATPCLVLAAATSGLVLAAATPRPVLLADLILRLRQVFADDTGARMADLAVAMAARDSDSAGRLLHGIKGSAAYLDAPELHQLAGELEAVADAGLWPLLGAALPRLRDLMQMVGAPRMAGECDEP